MPSEDLWGELPGADATVKPSTLLREQASLLGAKTKNLIEGEVREYFTGDPELIGFRFFINCPAVGNYRYHVLTLTHPLLHVFPAKVQDHAHGREHQAANEEELRSVLKGIFTSGQVRRVIAALLREAAAPVS